MKAKPFQRIAPRLYRHTYEYPLVIVALLLLLWPAWCFGDVEEDNGNMLLTSCEDAIASLDTPKSVVSKSLLGAAYCFGLVQGIVAMSQVYEYRLKKAAFLCVPTSVTNGQSARISLKYLRDHPEELHEQSSVLAFKALQAAFPCTKR